MKKIIFSFAILLPLAANATSDFRANCSDDNRLIVEAKPGSEEPTKVYESSAYKNWLDCAIDHSKLNRLFAAAQRGNAQVKFRNTDSPTKDFYLDPKSFNILPDDLTAKCEFSAVEIIDANSRDLYRGSVYIRENKCRQDARILNLRIALARAAGTKLKFNPTGGSALKDLTLLSTTPVGLSPDTLKVTCTPANSVQVTAKQVVVYETTRYSTDSRCRSDQDFIQGIINKAIDDGKLVNVEIGNWPRRNLKVSNVDFRKQEFHEDTLSEAVR